MPWESESETRPDNYNPVQQLRNIIEELTLGQFESMGDPIDHRAWDESDNPCTACGFRSHPAHRHHTESVFGNACPACGYLVGYHRDVLRIGTEEWRLGWIARGMPWECEQAERPIDWIPDSGVLVADSPNGACGRTTHKPIRLHMNGSVTYVCHVCGYPYLTVDAYNAGGSSSEQHCPSCGFLFGWEDDYAADTITDFRELWKEYDCVWYSDTVPPPPGLLFLFRMTQDVLLWRVRPNCNTAATDGD